MLSPTLWISIFYQKESIWSHQRIHIPETKKNKNVLEHYFWIYLFIFFKYLFISSHHRTINRINNNKNNSQTNIIFVEFRISRSKKASKNRKWANKWHIRRASKHIFTNDTLATLMIKLDMSDEYKRLFDIIKCCCILSMMKNGNIVRKNIYIWIVCYFVSNMNIFDWVSFVFVAQAHNSTSV